MIYLLQMPTRSIFADDDENSVKKLRSNYEPIFLRKLATIQNSDIKSFEKRFKHLKLSAGQYQPGDDLVEFINKNHDENIHFRRLPLIPNPHDISVSYPPDHAFKVNIELTEAQQQSLLIEGVYDGISATEIIREWIELFIRARKEVHAGRDASEQLKKISEYVTGKPAG